MKPRPARQPIDKVRRNRRWLFRIRESTKNLGFMSDPTVGLFKDYNTLAFMKPGTAEKITQTAQAISRILRDRPMTNHVIDLLHDEDSIDESIRARRAAEQNVVCFREVFEQTSTAVGGSEGSGQR